jgi:glycosyltransferase involved in cell wall biosynthesis
MKVKVLMEYRFFRDHTGQVYTESSYDYGFWLRYLSVFSSVTVVARALWVDDSGIKANWKKVTGTNVCFQAVPYYHGMKGLLAQLHKVLYTLRKIAREPDTAFIFRMPSFIGVLFFIVNRSFTTASYGVEMVGDPREVFSSLPPRYKRLGNIFSKRCESIVYNAVAVAYVERVILPVRYPVRMKEHSFFFSSISLMREDILDGSKQLSAAEDHLNIISIGSLDQMYKGPDILLKALKLCKAQGMSFKLTWVGSGSYLDRIRQLAEDLGLDEWVSFRGVVTGRAAVNRELDGSDLFVLASRTEGLPRAMIEAMARGLPCIGSRVGGIPELLSAPFLFEKDDITALAALLIKLSKDKDKLQQMSRANIATSLKYLNETLDKERERFYRAVRNGSTHSYLPPANKITA